MSDVKKIVLHPISKEELDQNTELYPKTNIEQVVGLSEALNRKANNDGYYEEMRVGNADNADQITSKVKVPDKVPYLFRTTGGALEVGDRKNEELVGVSIPFQQLVNNGNFSSTTGWYALKGTLSAQDNVMTYTVAEAPTSYNSNKVYTSGSMDAAIAGHVYLSMCDLKPSISAKVAFHFINATTGSVSALANTWVTSVGIGKAISAWHEFQITFSDDYASLGVGDTVQIRNAMCFDLTAMFGSAVADRIYEMEQSTAGSGVSFFRKWFPALYYAYSATASIISAKPSKVVTVGFNLLNSTTGKANLVGGKQYQITGTYTALSYSTGEILTPDANGKFTPTKDGELTVTGADDSTTCVHLVWDGERDGEWEAYAKHEYPLGNVELRGILKLDSSNNVYADGDTYSHDGTVTRNYDYRDYQEGDESLADAVTDGVNTVVKKATSTTESTTAFADPMIIDNWGTEEFVDTRTIPVPVGHKTQYWPNLRAKLEAVPDNPSNNGLYCIQVSNGAVSYVALPIYSGGVV